jgi:long-chain fatty acid transport protein
MEVDGMQCTSSKWLANFRSLSCASGDCEQVKSAVWQGLVREAVVLVLFLSTANVHATGFFISGQTPTAVGRALAGNNVMAEDATTVFWNPAGMTHLARAQAVSTGSIFNPTVGVSNDGTTAVVPVQGTRSLSTENDSELNGGEAAFVPGFALAQPLGERWWFGLSASSPYGLSTRYPNSWFGRYDSQESSLLTVDLAPSVAFKLNRSVSFGAGVDIQYAHTKLVNALPNPVTPGGPSAATDGQFHLRADDISLGFNIGAMIDIDDATRVALHYRSAVEHQLQGTATTSGLTGPLALANGRSTGSASFYLPGVLSVGAAHSVGNVTWLARCSWSDWSGLDEVRIRFDNGTPDQIRALRFQDAYMLALGAEVRPRGPNDAWTWRGGFAYESAISRDSFRNSSIPDSNHYWASLGFTYRRDTLRFDFGYAHLFYDGTFIDLTQTFYGQTPLQTTVFTKARVQNETDILSMGVGLTF